MVVTEPSHVAEARRGGAALARDLELDETAAGRLALVVTEAATNVLKHGGGGEVLVQAVPGPLLGSANGDCQAPPRTVEVLALDKGPGMADIDACLRDGYSTSGSPGTGLGAIQRLADLFDICSLPGRGTALLVRVGPTPRPDAPEAVPERWPSFEAGAVNLPKPGETDNGDAWSACLQPAASSLLLVDGLGHGSLAATAAREAVRAFEHRTAQSPAEIIEAIHRALRSTRGAAGAVVQVQAASRGAPGQVRFVGVGNITGTVWSGLAARHLVSHNGTLGHEVTRIQEFVYEWPADGVLVMATDGLATQLKPGDYPGLLRRHPSLVAGVLYRDYKRGRDDATVIVLRQRSRAP